MVRTKKQKPVRTRVVRPSLTIEQKSEIDKHRMSMTINEMKDLFVLSYGIIHHYLNKNDLDYKRDEWQKKLLKPNSPKSIKYHNNEHKEVF